MQCPRLQFTRMAILKRKDSTVWEKYGTVESLADHVSRVVGIHRYDIAENWNSSAWFGKSAKY